MILFILMTYKLSHLFSLYSVNFHMPKGIFTSTWSVVSDNFEARNVYNQFIRYPQVTLWHLEKEEYDVPSSFKTHQNMWHKNKVK